MKKQGYQIFCSDLTGENIYNVEKLEKPLIIFSNEAHGPSKEILEITDRQITIPKTGNTDSLNVAIAAWIIISHFKKDIAN